MMGLRAGRVAQALVLLSATSLALGQYGYNDDLNYYDDYQLYTAGYHYDMYDESDDGFYYNQYTGDYDDVYGDYFFEDADELEADCRIGADGKPFFNGTGDVLWVWPGAGGRASKLRSEQLPLHASACLLLTLVCALPSQLRCPAT